MWIWLVVCGVIASADFSTLRGVEGLELCSQIVASLTTRMGDSSETRSGQHIGIRQCPLDQKRGTFQIAAWEAGATAPSLVIDPESRSIQQLVMIPGAYAFEIVGGAATRIYGVVYEGGRPRQAVYTSTKGRVSIESDASRIIIRVQDKRRDQQRTYILKARD